MFEHDSIIYFRKKNMLFKINYLLQVTCIWLPALLLLAFFSNTTFQFPLLVYFFDWWPDNNKKLSFIWLFLSPFDFCLPLGFVIIHMQQLKRVKKIETRCCSARQTSIWVMYVLYWYKKELSHSYFNYWQLSCCLVIFFLFVTYGNVF